ncbi:MAG: HTH-type transcriptional repressor [Acidimicrobiales bacterium]|nr:HTH-type transcriptional repressor [Acidimicrobiales bacterium]
MSTTQTRPAGVETRRTILEAALDLFAERGFDGASTRLIAERAGVTQPLLHYHFAGKEELWRAALDGMFDRVRSSMESRLRGLRGVNEITVAKLMVRHFVEFSASNPQLFRIIMQESKQPGPRLDWLVDTHVRPLYTRALAIFERLGASGELAPVAPAHLYYLLTGAGASVFAMAPECQRLTGVDPFTPEFVTAHADLVVDLLVRAATNAAT